MGLALPVLTAYSLSRLTVQRSASVGFVMLTAAVVLCAVLAC